MTLIDRLRTGTHEQAVGLLRECREIVKPEPDRNWLRDGLVPEIEVAWGNWYRWNVKFDALLRIGTPEACVGAAMMLIPDDCCIERMGEVPDNPEPSRWHCVLWREDENVPANAYPGEESSTAALALAAAIMETRNG